MQHMVYQGQLARPQAGADGLLDAQGAAALCAEAWRIAQGGAAAVDADSLQLRRLHGPAPGVGAPVRATLDAGAPGGGCQLLLHGPGAPAWAATLQVDAGLPPLPGLPAPAEGLPPLQLLRHMGPARCDQAGHVNVQVFLDLADEAVAALGHSLAPGAPRPQITGARILFKAELFAGDVMAVHSGVRAADAGGADLVQAIVRQPAGAAAGQAGQLACLLETRVSALGADGQPAALPWGAAALPAQPWPALPPARPLAEPRAAARPGASARATAMTVVDAWDACADGWLQPRALLNLCSTGARQFLAQAGLDGRRMAADQITVAAVDYAIALHRRPRLGQNLTLRSAPLSVSAKAVRFAHHLVDSDDGTLQATVEIVGVMLDLRSHRAGEVPADVRHRLQAWLAEA